MWPIDQLYIELGLDYFLLSLLKFTLLSRKIIIVEVPDEYLKKILGYGSSEAEIIDRSRNKKIHIGMITQIIWKLLKTVVIFADM